MTCARCRHAMRRRAEATRRCSKWGRCARGCCWRATSPRPTPACRSPTWSSAGPTSRSCSTTTSFRPSCSARRPAGWRRLPRELLGLLHQRGEALAGRVAATGRGAAAEFADFLMLQAINRYEPLLAHYAEAGAIHPESLFHVCVTAAGELATFTTTSKRPPKLPAYRHDQSAGVVRPGDRGASRIVEQGARRRPPFRSRSSRRNSGSAWRS